MPANESSDKGALPTLSAKHPMVFCLVFCILLLSPTWFSWNFSKSFLLFHFIIFLLVYFKVFLSVLCFTSVSWLNISILVLHCLLIASFEMAYYQKRFYVVEIRQLSIDWRFRLRVTTSDYECLQVRLGITASGYEWPKVTISNNKWISVTANDHDPDYEWIQVFT